MTPAPHHSRHRLVRGLFGSLAVSLALAAPLGPALAADPNEFSEAEKLVFVEHQLANVKAPTTLRYTFVKSGSLEPGFEDQVLVEVSDIKPTGSSVTTDFLSGSRKIKLPDVDNARPNPVILYFLEHDIREMARLTNRKTSNYFRNRIRKTLVDQAQIRDTTITFDGQTLAAREVTLSPYANDPARVRYERYANKRYVFLLSEAVPGGVYEMRTTMLGAQPNEAPMLEEVMTFAGPVTRSAAIPKNQNQPVKSR